MGRCQLAPVRARIALRPSAVTLLAPRVLLVMPGDRERALLRAELRELGYDAIGVRDFPEAFLSAAPQPERGPVRLILVDQETLSGSSQLMLQRLLSRDPAIIAVLLGRSTASAPSGAWREVLRRPVSIATIARALQTLLPLPAELAHPIDRPA